MSESYETLARSVDKCAGALHKAIPEMMGPYGQLAQAAGEAGELSSKTRELMAMAIGVVIRCEGCIAYHMRGAIRQGATEKEIAEALGVSIEMGGGPAVVYAGQALAAYPDLLASVDAA